jgi:hypothetical protein
MFNLYYAGKKSVKEIVVGTFDRSAWGDQMAALRWGSKSYTKAGYDTITPENIETTHTYVASTTLSDLEEIFESFQGMFCSKDFSDLIKESDATHTSMSCGDIAWDRTTGEMFICDPVGWTDIS